jgi:hypothetical protein
MIIYSNESSTWNISHIMPSHQSAIYGVQVLDSKTQDEFSFISGSDDKSVKRWKVKVNGSKVSVRPNIMNGNLCDTFEHLKFREKVEKSDDDEIGRVRSLLLLPF